MNDSNNGRRYNIGLLIDGLENEFSYAVCSGAAEYAERLDHNLFIFSSNSQDAAINTVSGNIYTAQHSSIFQYAQPDHLDAVIIAYSKIFGDLESDGARRLRKRFRRLPVVTLNREEEGCGCVRFNDMSAGLEELLSHIIHYHGCTDIAFVSGAEEHPESISRVGTYRKTLEENGIPFDESRVIYGDFRQDSRDKIKRLFRDKEHIPQAICCANDRLAADAYDVCEKYGLKIGEDIIVTGYDNSVISVSLVPSLTTVNLSCGAMGVQAVKLACEMLETGRPRTVTLETMPILRDSCGPHLKKGGKKYNADYIESLIERYCQTYADLTGGADSELLCAIKAIIDHLKGNSEEPLETDELMKVFDRAVGTLAPNPNYGIAVCDITRMLQFMMSLTDVSERSRTELFKFFTKLYTRMCMQLVGVSDRLMSDSHSSKFFINNIIDFVDFEPNTCLGKMMHQLRRLGLKNSYIFLSPEPVLITDPQIAVPMDVLRLVAYHHDSDCYVPSQTVEIKRDELFTNKYVTYGQRGTYLTAPLYTMHEQLGIAIFDVPADFLGYAPIIERQISAALETLTLFNQFNSRIEDVVRRNSVLRTIASEDALTGLLNRYGFFESSESRARHPDNIGRRALVAFVDMNNLKMTNDTFGHEAGDFALNLIKQALIAGFPKGSIIGRIGGDEFAVFTVPDDGDSEEVIKERVLSILGEMNRNSGKPFNVSLSIGFTAFECGDSVVMRGYLDKADSMLYDDKRNKPKSILKV